MSQENFESPAIAASAGPPCLAVVSSEPRRSSAVVMATGKRGDIIGSHPVGGVHLRYQDGTESSREYIQWSQIRLVD